MFQFPTYPHVMLCVHITLPGSLLPGGFPHSDIRGSSAICASPQLFAACHVLLRLLVPRHPPYALRSLTSSLYLLSHLLGLLSGVSFKLPFRSLFFALLALYGFQGTSRFFPSTTVLSHKICLPLFYKIFLAVFYGHRYMVGSNGIEPSTSRLSGVRSNRLSYEPVF